MGSLASYPQHKLRGETMLEHIIFAIDNDHEPHVVAKFMRHCDTERAMMRMPALVQLIGCYKGQMERSYMLPAKCLDAVKDFIKYQESILRVPGDTRQPCVLEYVQTGERVSICAMREVSAIDAWGLDAWTYDPKADKYFACY